MARLTATQTNWFGGQISEKGLGNQGDELYPSSSAKLENLVVQPSGGLARRPGTKFVARTDGNSSLGNEAKRVRLVPFVFGHENADNYVLEFGQGYIKFYKNGAILNGTNASNGAETHLKITGSPYGTNEKLEALNFVQSADVLFLTSPKVAPYRLSRSVGTTAGTWRTSDGYIWTLEAFPYKNGPYLGQQEDTVTGSTDTVIDVSGGTAITAHTATTGKAFINENFGGATQQFANNGAYEGATGNLANLSHFQVKNHGLQEGMLITLSGGNGSGTSHIPKDGTWTVRNPTANTFQIATSATADISVFSNTGSTPAITAEGDAEHKVFAQYYAKGSTLTLTAKSPSGSNVNMFTTSDVGRHFRLSLLKKNQIWWVWGKLSGITGTQHTATFTLEEDCPISGDLTGITMWKFGEWYVDQYPHFVNIFQQRMVFGRNSRSPQTVWFSETGDYETYKPSETLGTATGEQTASGADIIGDQVVATNGMTFTFDSGTVDEIQWLVAQQKLLAGSTGGVYSIYGSENDITITPFNFTIKRESTYPAQTGSNAVPYDNKLMFIQGTGKKVRLVTYGDVESAATSADITFRADDILREQAVQIAETDIPNFITWFRLKDGTLGGLTYVPELKILAWHTHKIGGDYTYTETREGDPTGHLTTDKSHAVVLDMCSIPSSTRDQLWMIVRRTIPVADGANTERIIESVELMEDWMTTEAISASNYLDGHVTHTGTNVASGELDHLEAETVSILADGSVLDDQVVNSSGQFTTAISSATTIISGMRFTSKMITVPIPVGPEGRIRIGNKKRIHRSWVKLYRTPNFQFGVYTDDATDADLSQLVTRTVANQYGEAPNLSSETKELIPKSMGFTEGQFQVVQSDPMPLNILAYEVDFETNDN